MHNRSACRRVPRSRQSPARECWLCFLKPEHPVVNMTPDFGIRDVAKRWPVDIDNEVPSRACDDDNLVSTVLSDPVKRVDKFRVALCVHNARPAVTVELDNQHALGVPFQLQLAIGREIVRFSCLHGIVLSWSALCTIASRVPESSVASPLEIKSVVQWQISTGSSRASNL